MRLPLLPEAPRQALSQFMAGSVGLPEMQTLRRYRLIELKKGAWRLSAHGEHAVLHYGFKTQVPVRTRKNLLLTELP